MGHGLLAAAALTLLLYTWFTAGLPPQAQLATAVLIGAALGGLFINLRFHARMLPLPVPLMFGHALVAVVGFVLLVLAALSGPGTIIAPSPP